jgi:hypothetical protein
MPWPGPHRGPRKVQKTTIAVFILFSLDSFSVPLQTVIKFIQ